MTTQVHASLSFHFPMKTGLFFPVIKQKRRKEKNKKKKKKPSENKSVNQALATFDVQRKIASKM